MIIGEFDHRVRPYVACRVYMQYDPTHSRLECTVRYADHTLDAA